ncbi:HutD family protein [Martelella alba]|uniref:HutD family protein n=1 Tax=Martelella alba TaxID=2590451 RepID=A0A506UBF4_9HYPH|nr:HutD family protein [Martelella alba]TPW29127.1 HutD family protein [Martelella alba]
MRILKVSAYRVMAWKNGGGKTAEIAVSPDGASMADFDWRLSMADVAGDGPFSAFPGIDRTLTVIEGAGMELSGDKLPATMLEPGVPFAFSGDEPVFARLTAGPIRDFNVMSRRGRIRHQVKAVRSQNRLEIRCDNDTMALVPLMPCRAGEIRLQPFATLMLNRSEACALTADVAITVLQIRIDLN